jgi:hypothetical protein
MPEAVKSLFTRPGRWRHTGAEEVWALSILRLVKFYGSVRIITDEQGAYWVDALRLPVAGRIKVTRELDDLAKVDPHLWSFGKLYANSLQKDPFFQTDGDTVIGRCLPERIHSAQVFCERIYENSPRDAKKKAEDQWSSWFWKTEAPGHWWDAYEANDGTSASCGIFGGRDTETIRRISITGMDFAQKNVAILKKIRADMAAVILEEWAVCREIDPMEISTLRGSDHAGHLMLARSKCFWHQQGKAKLEKEVQQRVKDKLEAECPGQVARCREVARAFSKVGDSQI